MSQPQPDLLPVRHWRLWLISILVLAVGLRLIYSIGIQRHLHHVLPELESTDGYHLLATNLFNGDGYTFRVGDPPTMLRPPGYPLAMIAVFALAGVDFLWVQVLNALLAGVACWLLFLMGRWVLSVQIGLVAALLFAVYPYSIVYASRLYTENLFFPLFIGLCYLLCRASSEVSGWRGAAAGVVWALGLLTRGSLVLLPLAVPIGLAISRAHRPRAQWRWIVPAILGAALTLTPWVWRNHALSGAIVPVSSWGWAPMYVGAQVSRHMDEWGTDLTAVDNGAMTELRTRVRRTLGWPDTRRSTGAADELMEEEVAKTAVLEEWRADPFGRAGRALAGLAFTWFLSYDASSLVGTVIVHGALLYFSVWGVCIMLRRYPESFWRAWPAMGTILFVNVFQAVAFPRARYMAPALAVAMVFAALPLWQWAQRLQPRVPPLAAGR